jgi:hypothetical protein
MNYSKYHRSIINHLKAEYHHEKHMLQDDSQVTASEYDISPCTEAPEEINMITQ